MPRANLRTVQWLLLHCPPVPQHIMQQHAHQSMTVWGNMAAHQSALPRVLLLQLLLLARLLTAGARSKCTAAAAARLGSRERAASSNRSAPAACCKAQTRDNDTCNHSVLLRVPLLQLLVLAQHFTHSASSRRTIATSTTCCFSIRAWAANSGH
jgi:hypothetical protein